MVPSPELARFFLEQSISPHTATRAIAVRSVCLSASVYPMLDSVYRGVIKIMVHIKMRSYSTSPEELWLDEWHSPMERTVTVLSPEAIRDELVDQTS